MTTSDALLENEDADEDTDMSAIQATTPSTKGVDEESLLDYESHLPEGRSLRQRTLRELDVERGHDYAEFFHELQIKPEQYDHFLYGVLRQVRSKHMGDIKLASKASIKNMSWRLLRGFGRIVWMRDAHEWLLEKTSAERLVYEKDSPNERFYKILRPMWLKMRDICFEEKQSARRGRPSRMGESASASATDKDEAYLADYETENNTPAPGLKDRLQTQRHFEQLAQNARSPSPSKPNFWSAEETDKAILDLNEQLHCIRLSSSPEIFNLLWEQRITRLDELEDKIESSNAGLDGTEPFGNLGPAQDITDRSRINPQSTTPLNLPNEPFASRGSSQALSFPRLLAAELPYWMTVYITAEPPSATYMTHAYCWTDAPVSLADQQKFFNGLNARVDVADNQITGYAISHGWDDVSRWIQNSVEGRRHGWSVFQRDLNRAAQMMVRTFRCKVLVVGRAK